MLQDFVKKQVKPQFHQLVSVTIIAYLVKNGVVSEDAGLNSKFSWTDQVNQLVNDVNYKINREAF